MHQPTLVAGSLPVPVAEPTPETAIVSMHLVARPNMRCNGGDYSTNLLVIYKSTLDLPRYFRLTMEVVRYLAYISYCNVPRIVVFDSYFRVF
ncbi:hypothetical protein CUJ84_pRLN4000097 (plasmid) [Rhizobium leguminosarum]|uniref:Uncharacterized protein n=1 Tax=Rhizobium leguminosarum TaxID=384 RepID=A0A2K9ZHR3_RHILE|nr:hypothetical protein CUJ84_pRLN4000097 [Rhizobium leguminosarum]